MPKISTYPVASAISPTDVVLGNVDGVTNQIPLSLIMGGILIQKQTLGANAASVTFAAIPATFNHLRLECTGRSDVANNFDDVKVQFNADTTDANYLSAICFGGASAGGSLETPGVIGTFAGATSPANYANSLTCKLANYKDTTWFKNWQSLTASNRNASSRYALTTIGIWLNTSAISQILLKPKTGTNFLTGSVFCLYGE